MVSSVHFFAEARAERKAAATQYFILTVMCWTSERCDQSEVKTERRTCFSFLSAAWEGSSFIPKTYHAVRSHWAVMQEPHHEANLDLALFAIKQWEDAGEAMVIPDREGQRAARMNGDMVSSKTSKSVSDCRCLSFQIPTSSGILQIFEICQSLGRHGRWESGTFVVDPQGTPMLEGLGSSY
jgi:hypothetical protein